MACYEVKIGDEFVSWENLSNTQKAQWLYDTGLSELVREGIIDMPQMETEVAQTKPQTLKEYLQQSLQNILKIRKGLDTVVSDYRRPTSQEMEEYKKLYERNRKSRNGLKQTDKVRFEELKDLFNNYGRAVGTLEGGIRLSDILDQISDMEQAENNAEVPQENDISIETIDAQLRAQRGNSDTSNKTQYWEKSEFKILPDGNYSITGINLRGLNDIVNGEVLRDKTRKRIEAPEGHQYKKGDKFIVSLPLGEDIQITIGDTGNLIFSPESAQILNDRTRLKLLGSTTLATNYQPLLAQINGNAVVSPVEIVNSNFELEPGLSFTDMTNEKDDTELSLFVSTANEYNKALIAKFQQGKIKLSELQRSLVVYVMNQKGEVGGVLKGLSKTVSNESSDYQSLSEIRNVIAQRVAENRLENSLIDVQITVPLDRNSSYFGKPNFNLEYNSETNTLSSQLITFTDRALDKVVDLGYITDGKLTLFENKKEEQKIDTTFVKKLSKGRQLPVIVFNYNGSRVAYPVNMNRIQRDKVSEFDQVLNSTLPATEKIKQLNFYLKQNGFNINDVNTGFYIVGSDSNLYDQKHVNNIRQQLSSQNTYQDFKQWMGAKNLQEAKDLLKQQATINIDITDKPFHSPKLALKLKNRVIIGSVSSPSNTIVEEAGNINTEQIIRDNSCNG